MFYWLNQSVRAVKKLTDPWNTQSLPVRSPIDAIATKATFFTTDGVELYYEDTANCGFPLIFLYGLGCSIFHWKHQMRHLADQRLSNGDKTFRVIWLDLRGHGLSEPWRPGLDLSFVRLSQDVRELCQHLRIQSAVFLGQSMGGTIALTLAAMDQTLPKGVIIQGSPVKGVTQTMAGGIATRTLLRSWFQLNHSFPGVIRLAFRLLDRHLRAPFQECIRFSGFNPKLARQEDIAEYVDHLLRADPNVFLRLAELLEEFEFDPLAKHIACPVLILAGVDDTLVSLKQNERLASSLGQADIAVIPHGSHCPHLDDPELVCTIIDKFLSRIIPRKA